MGQTLDNQKKKKRWLKGYHHSLKECFNQGFNKNMSSLEVVDGSCGHGIVETSNMLHSFFFFFFFFFFKKGLGCIFGLLD